MIQYLRQEADKAKEIHNKKYWIKIKHLEERYRIEKEEKRVPQGMENLSHLRVFSEELYEDIKTDKIEIPVIGDIELTPEEEYILRKNPKFAIPERLLEDTLREDMEKAYSLLRMELRDEEGENREETAIQDKKRTKIQTEEDEDREQAAKEEEAKTRQVFCPIEKTYDERNRRVTDLVECSRVTLPKPISIEREAQIEMRRTIHERIYQEYRREKCNEKGEQEQNLTREENEGMKRLLKRIEKENLVIMKTDKSGKMSVTRRDGYLKMGKDHTEGDKWEETRSER